MGLAQAGPAARWYDVKQQDETSGTRRVCKTTIEGDLTECQVVEFGEYTPEKGFIGGGGSWVTFVEPSKGLMTCGLDDETGTVENEGCVVTLEPPYQGTVFSTLVVNERNDKAWVGFTTSNNEGSNDGWLVCSLTQEGLYVDCSEGTALGQVYDIVVAPGGDDLYIIPPELTKVVYCDGSLKEPCRPVMGLDASGKTGHVLLSFASPDTVYVEHIALSGEYNVAYDGIYVLERCNVVEPGVFSNCEVVRNSPDAYYLDLVFANNGENVYVASATDDSEQDEERFFNPFKYLASLFAFRKPGPNVYVTQHVNLCYGGNCNITIEDIMEFTLGNITYDYSKHRSLLPDIENGSFQDKGFVWHVCKVHAANFTTGCKPVVDLHNAIAVTRPVSF